MTAFLGLPEAWEAGLNISLPIEDLPAPLFSLPEMAGQTAFGLRHEHTMLKVHKNVIECAWYYPAWRKGGSVRQIMEGDLHDRSSRADTGCW